MSSYLKKLIIPLFFISFFFSSYANEYPLGRKKVRSLDKDKKMTSGYNETGRVQVRGSWDLFIAGSFIYWQPIEENLDMAVSSPNYNNPLITQEYYKMKFNWKPGLKISAGIISDHDDWSIIANYTWLHTKNKKSHGRSVNDMIVPYTLVDTSNIYNFSAIWYLNLDLINLQLARRLHLGKKLIVQPYGGISLAFIDQKYYFDTTARSDDFIYQPFSRDRSDSWGLGPKIGLDTEWNLTDHFRIIANLSGEILYTCYRIRNKSYHLYRSNALHNLQVKIDRNYLRPMTDIATGISWGTYLGDDFWHIEISTLYEFHILWNQNMLSANSKGYDLYLNGLTVTVKLDF